MIYAPVLTWWLLLQLFGLVGLPLAFRLFGNLPDRGYAFARPLGLLLTGYLLWLGGSLGFWRNSVGGTLVAALIVAGVGVWLYLSRPDKDASILGWLRGHTRYWLAVEALFAVALLGWTIYKSYNPNLETAGGEKWMEIAFVNATLRSDYFPPHDPWMSGFGISYYYFGYVLMAMVTRLSGLPATVAYNLFIPTLFALTLTGAFSLVYNLVAGRAESDAAADRAGPIGYGLLGAMFVGVLGNLEGLLEVFHSRGLFPAGFWSWLDIIDINSPPAPDGWIPTRFIWWWRASRVIHDCSFHGLLVGNCNPPNGSWEVIDEFPFFSFMLGDVHPHVLALPFVLLALALALNQISNIKYQIANLQSLTSNLRLLFGGWPQFLIYAVCLGALGFLNTWDFPIYLLVVTAAVAFGRARGGSPGWLNEALVAGLGLGVLGGVLYLPFYVGFRSQASGILPNLFNPTRLQQFLVFFGPFLFVCISYLAVLSQGIARPAWRRSLPASLALTLAAPVLALLAAGVALAISPTAQAWVEGVLRDPDLQALLGDASFGSLGLMALRIRLSNPWTFLFLGSLLAWVLLLANQKYQASNVQSPPARAAQPGQATSNLQPPPARAAQPGRATSNLQPLISNLHASPSDQFALILVGVGLLLPLVVEFVYLRDLFGTRLNTVFKFYFQAWVLLALASAYGTFVVSSRLPVPAPQALARGLGGLAWRLVLAALVLGGLVYPVLSVPNKTGDFAGPPTLDGMAWLEAAHPDDYAAIRWLQANVTGAPVILEAWGGSYQYAARVSALTGLPTVLGWDFHEYQWRGSYDEPSRRKTDIDILYNTLDLTQTLTLLDKYAITYVYVGRLERERYNPSALAKFDRLMKVVYRKGAVTIYQRN
jgi:YYY domain-containing protein